MGVETVFLETIDGVSIEADLIRTAALNPRATVIIGHPHPEFGGDKNSHVVRALQEAAFHADCHSIAIDFRGVGNSSGFHDDGDSERLDLAAAIELAEMVEPECPIIMSGYSFGSMVALNVTHPLITSWIAVAPPLSLMPNSPLAASNYRPKFIIAAEHDQFTLPEVMKESMNNWTNTSIDVAYGVDHFFAVDALSRCSDALAKALDSL
jgi:hypothetical protein